MFDAFLNYLLNNDFSFRNVTRIGIGDMIDMLIISYLTYKILVWVKETRAWMLLKGFLVILLFYVTAQFLNLHTVQWLIRNTLNVGLIAVIVLFQPELRRVLEQLGKGRFLEGFAGGQSGGKISAATAEAVVTAVAELSKARTGALIVVEREVGMAEYEQSGIKIDSEVSSQLLVNIFEHNTPLHDGAVLLRENRIAAACCILPLTENDVDKRFGTRHRAALGASEVSDACVVVVSEETGKISVAMGGKLQRSISEERLRKILVVDSVNGRKKEWKKPAFLKEREPRDR